MVEQPWKNISKMYYHLASLENTYPLGDQQLPCKGPAAFCLHSKKLLCETLYFKDMSPNFTSQNPKLVPQSLGKEMKMNI